MLTTGQHHDGPSAVRYPRGTGPGAEIASELTPLPIGMGELRRQGKGVALLAFGALLAPALEAAEELDATVANMRFVKPLDEALILKLAAEHELLLTLEDNVVMGGAGSAVSECLAAHGVNTRIHHLGLPDEFVEQGGREEILAMCGLDKDGIIRAFHEKSQGSALQTVINDVTP